MIDFPEDFWRWVDRHSGDNPAELVLRFKGKYLWLESAVTQIECRRKTRKKLGEELENPRFYFPSVLSAEQSTGDELARFHASLIPAGSSVLDMTAGLGVDALHLARVASSVTAVERNASLCEALEYNAGILGMGNISVVNGDCVEYIEKYREKYDVIFIDPARRSSDGGRVYGLADCQPDVVEILPMIQRCCGMLIVKASPMLDISQTLRELPGVNDIYATGNNTECKEIVAVLNFNSKDGEPKIHAVTGRYDFSFYRSEDAGAVACLSAPEYPGFIYEPSPVIMKVAPFRLLSQRFGILKIGANSNLYWSREYLRDFPGDVLKIERVMDYSSANIKRFAREYPAVRIAVRNFGMSAAELRAKLKVKDGGSLRLFATTAGDSRKILVVASEINR